MSATEAATATALITGAPHVFADAGIDQHAARIAGVIDRPSSPRPDGTRSAWCCHCRLSTPLLGLRCVLRPGAALPRRVTSLATAPVAAVAWPSMGWTKTRSPCCPARARQRSGRGPDTVSWRWLREGAGVVPLGVVPESSGSGVGIADRYRGFPRSPAGRTAGCLRRMRGRRMHTSTPPPRRRLLPRAPTAAPRGQTPRPEPG